MSKLIRNLLLIVNLLMIIFLLIPSPEKPLPSFSQEDSLEEPEMLEKNRDEAAVYSPYALSRMFPVIRPLPVDEGEEAPEAPEKKIKTVSWLKFLAIITSEDGMPTYYFKDDRTGRVLKLRQNQDEGGWRLLEIQEKWYEIQNEDTIYKVNK